MPTNFPTALDVLNNPLPGQSQNASRTHSEQHGDLNDAMEAVQAAVGVTGSGVATSLNFAMRHGAGRSILDFIPRAQWSAIVDRTSTYDAAADINTALASGVRGLIVPAGLYNIGAPLVRPAGKSLSIVGAGAFSSTFRFTAAGGLAITLDDYIERCNISGLDFQATVANAGTAISVTAPSVASNNMQNALLQNVSLWSDLGAGYWSRGILLTHCWHYLLDKVHWKGASAQANWGDFIELAGRSLDGDITRVKATGMNRGVLVNSADVEGMRIDKSTFVAARKGVYKASGASRPPHYSITDTHIAAHQACIDINSVSSLFVTDNLLYLGTQAGETVPNGSAAVFVNDAAGVRIRGNQISGRDAGIPTTRYGAVVTSTVSSFHITENYCDLFTNPIWVQTGNTGPGRVRDNDYLLNTTNSTLDQSTSGVVVSETGSVIPRDTRRSTVIAKLAASVTNVTGDATVYTVLFDELADPTGEYVPASGVFTAARAGKYHISANVLLTGLAAAHTDGKVRIDAGGSAYEGHGNPAAGKTTFGWQTMHHEVSVSLTAGQTVTVSAQVSNSTKVVGVGAGSSLVIRYEAE